MMWLENVMLKGSVTLRVREGFVYDINSVNQGNSKLTKESEHKSTKVLDLKAQYWALISFNPWVWDLEAWYQALKSIRV